MPSVIGGVVDQRQRRAVPVGETGDRRLIGRDIGDVAFGERHRRPFGIELLGECRAALGLDVDEPDPGALCRKCAYQRLADAAGAAGNHDGAVLKTGIGGKSIAHGVVLSLVLSASVTARCRRRAIGLFHDDFAMREREW